MALERAVKNDFSPESCVKEDQLRALATVYDCPESSFFLTGDSDQVSGARRVLGEYVDKERKGQHWNS